MRSAPFGGEDTAFRYYLAAMFESQIPGRDPFEGRIVEFALICPRCGTRDDWGVDTRGVQRCRGGGLRCGVARPQRFVVRGSGPSLKGRAPGRSGNRRLERVAELGLVFGHLHIWERRSWAGYILAGSYTRAFHNLRKGWPRRKGGWSLQTVRILADDARDRARPMLERRGLIES